MKFVVYKNSQVNSARQKIYRQEKRVGNLKNVIETLKEQDAHGAAEYLEVS